MAAAVSCGAWTAVIVCARMSPCAGEIAVEQSSGSRGVMALRESFAAALEQLIDCKCYEALPARNMLDGE